MQKNSFPKVSIIIPAYKVEKYIAKYIESIKKQIFTEFECIIVDNAAPDKSIEISKDIVRDDSRFIFLFQKKEGVNTARGLGAEKAIGEYIMFVADDYLFPDSLSKMIETAQNTHADIIYDYGNKQVQHFN